MSQPWFRFYASALNDPKVQRLEPGLFKTWVNLLCVASENDGELPARSDLAFALRVPEDALAADYDALVSAGLIDEFEDHVTPHNWSGRQFQSDVSTDRVKRFRDKKRNVSETASETPPDTEQNISEQIRAPEAPTKPEPKSRKASRLPEDWEPSERDIAFAKSRGVPDAQIKIEALKFKNHWLSKNKDATKLDWSKTWQTWVLNCCEFKGYALPPGDDATREVVEFVPMHDARWAPLAERFQRENGKPPPTMNGVGGPGRHFPKSWIDDSLEIPASLKRTPEAA